MSKPYTPLRLLMICRYLTIFFGALAITTAALVALVFFGDF